MVFVAVWAVEFVGIYSCVCVRVVRVLLFKT